MSMAEKDQASQIETRRTAARAEAFAVRSGAITGPLLIIGLLVITVMLYQDGKNAAALASLLGALALGLGPQVVGMMSQRQPKAQVAPAKASTAKQQLAEKAVGKQVQPPS